MRHFFLAVCILALVIVGVGWYRNWFAVTTQDRENQTDIRIQVDKQRINEDTAAAKEKIKEEAGALKRGARDVGEHVRERAGVLKEKTKDAAEAVRKKSTDKEAK